MDIQMATILQIFATNYAYPRIHKEIINIWIQIIVNKSMDKQIKSDLTSTICQNILSNDSHSIWQRLLSDDAQRAMTCNDFTTASARDTLFNKCRCLFDKLNKHNIGTQTVALGKIRENELRKQYIQQQQEQQRQLTIYNMKRQQDNYARAC
eukprot:UN08953